MVINLTRLGIQEIGLRNLCSDIKKSGKVIERMLEIGSYAGDSAKIFKEEFPDSILFCVDPWENGYDPNDSSSYLHPMEKIEDIFNQKILNLKKIIKAKLTSDEFFSIIPNNYFDFIYIDGCHKYEYVKRDIINSIKKLRVGGILAGHDYIDQAHLKGVYKAVNELLGHPDKLYEDGSWIFWEIKQKFIY